MEASVRRGDVCDRRPDRSNGDTRRPLRSISPWEPSAVAGPCPSLGWVAWVALGSAALLAAVSLVAWRNRAILGDSGRLAVRLVKHPDVPRPLRWLLVFAAMPVPGPFDEIAGGLGVLVLMRVRRTLVLELWRDVRAERAGGESRVPARRPR